MKKLNFILISLCLIFGFWILIFFVGGCGKGFEPTPVPSSTPTTTSTPSASASSSATATPTPSASQTPEPTPTPSNHWSLLISGTTQDLKSVFFLTSLEGWVTGRNGTLRHTINGGLTWESMAIGVNSDTIYQVFFIGQNGWTVSGGSTSSVGGIQNTTNGGQTWAQLGNSDGDRHGVFFVSSTEGWVVGGNQDMKIYHTTNNSTWENQPNPVNSTSDLILERVYFMGTEEGWVIGTKNTILHTPNRGATWEAQTSGLANENQEFNSLYFTDSENGFIVGNDGVLIHTSNGGQSWTTLNPSVMSGIQLNEIFFLNSSQGYVVGNSGYIFSTTDSGNNWVRQMSGTTSNLTGIYFSDETNGWAVGDSGKILKYSP